MSVYTASVVIEAKSKRAMTLGEVIDALRQAGDTEPGRVEFSFPRMVPTDIDSYRGSYDMPALGWEIDAYNKEGLRVTPHSLAYRLEQSIGHRYCGWKGGTYTYNRDDILCVDNSGECNQVVIEKIELIYDKKYAVLHTRKMLGDEGYPHDL